MSLLPIGSEFVYEYPSSLFCTETMVSRWTYRVVAHDKTQRGMAMRLEPLHCEKLYPVRMTLHYDRGDTTVRKLGKKFGVSGGLISKILRGEKRKEG